MSKMFVTASFACETAMLLWAMDPDIVPPQIPELICPYPAFNRKAILSIPPRFIIGSTLLFAGGCIRVWCYRSLGSLHTYEVALRPDHKLVMSGPYAYVRHPSYTAVTISILGVIFLHFSEGGWNSQCGIMHSGIGWWVRLYILLAIFSVWSLIKRGRIEDGLLAKQFGDEWTRYSTSVRYRFLYGLC